MSQSRGMTSTTAGAAVALALVVVQFAALSLAPSAIWVRITLPTTIVLAAGAVWVHRHRLGSWVIFVGLAANLAAILANGGLMPISFETVEAAIGPSRAATYESGAWIPGSKDVFMAPGDGHLLALGDAIIVRAGGSGIAASAGDVVIAAGIITLAGEAAARWAVSRRTTDIAADEGQTDTRTRTDGHRAA